MSVPRPSGAHLDRGPEPKPRSRREHGGGSVPSRPPQGGVPQTGEGRPGAESGAAIDHHPGPILRPEDAHLFDTGASPSRAAVGALLALPDLADKLALSVLVDACREALPAFWCRRARELETVGTSWADEAALEARRHAWLIDAFGLPDGLLGDLRAGVAA